MGNYSLDACSEANAKEMEQMENGSKSRIWVWALVAVIFTLGLMSLLPRLFKGASNDNSSQIQTVPTGQAPNAQRQQSSAPVGVDVSKTKPNGNSQP